MIYKIIHKLKSLLKFYFRKENFCSERNFFYKWKNYSGLSKVETALKNHLKMNFTHLIAKIETLDSTQNIIVQENFEIKNKIDQLSKKSETLCNKIKLNKEKESTFLEQIKQREEVKLIQPSSSNLSKKNSEK
jgi:hypothetical protein